MKKMVLTFWLRVWYIATLKLISLGCLLYAQETPAGKWLVPANVYMKIQETKEQKK